MMVHHHPDAFNDSHLSLVEAAINQVANALYNAQLYLLIRDQAERLGKMLRVEQVEAAKNQAILESIADGVLVADEAGVITVANLATSQILDVNREQLLGRGVRELSGIYGPSGDKWINAIQKWARNPEDVAERAVLEDQITVEEKVINVLLSPVFARNRFFGTVSIFRDITQAVEVDRIKSEFVSTVSHELRTPMTSIKGYADLILMGMAGKLSPSQSQYVEVIKDNADRLSVLVNDLLDISRIETGKVELDLRSMDVGKVVQDVVNSHLAGRIQHEAKTINASVEVVGTLPQVRGDVARVTQILTNLVDNAFNYTLEGGRIRVRAEAVDGHVAVSVADTGIGISPEDLPKIFDRFYRADDDEVQRISGTGLGLAIVNSLVEMHGGVLEVNSKPGRGSIFSFTLPLAKGADAP
jgi:PAS domain S-box-containing protein